MQVKADLKVIAYVDNLKTLCKYRFDFLWSFIEKFVFYKAPINIKECLVKEL